MVALITELLTTEVDLQGFPAARAALCMEVECIEYRHLLWWWWWWWWWWWSVLVDFYKLTLWTGEEGHCGIVVVGGVCINGSSSS